MELKNLQQLITVNDLKTTDVKSYARQRGIQSRSQAYFYPGPRYGGKRSYWDVPTGKLIAFFYFSTAMNESMCLIKFY